MLAWFESDADDLACSFRLVAAEDPGVHVLPTHGRVRKAGAELLGKLADAVARYADRDVATNESRSYHELARALFGDGDAAMAARSESQFAYANFVRAVLEAVRTLPASPAR